MVTAVDDDSAVPSCPPGLPSAAQVLGRAGGENFTVASRLLPGRARAHLLAFYGYARLVDYLGDDYAGDRPAALDWAEAVLDVAVSPTTTTGPGAAPTTARGLITAAARSAEEVGAGPVPLRLLIDANRMDQRRSSYETWDDLVGYCRLSANPVGHLVLAAFGASTPSRRLLSDDICTALQVAEHLQDVAEDALAGRTYLPREDLGRFGVGPGELVELARTGGPAPAPVRALIAFEAWRARQLLERGSALLRRATGQAAPLRGAARLAVAGFVAGGHGALDAVAAAGYDPFAGPPRPSRRRVAAHLARLLSKRAAA